MLVFVCFLLEVGVSFPPLTAEPCPSGSAIYEISCLALNQNTRYWAAMYAVNHIALGASIAAGAHTVLQLTPCTLDNQTADYGIYASSTGVSADLSCGSAAAVQTIDTLSFSPSIYAMTGQWLAKATGQSGTDWRWIGTARADRVQGTSLACITISALAQVITPMWCPWASGAYALNTTTGLLTLAPGASLITISGIVACSTGYNYNIAQPVAMPIYDTAYSYSGGVVSASDIGVYTNGIVMPPTNPALYTISTGSGGKRSRRGAVSYQIICAG